MTKDIVLLGGGGFAIELLEYMRHDKIFPAGYCAPNEEVQLRGFGLPYLGSEDDIHNKHFKYVIASGEIPIRLKMIDFLRKKQTIPLSFISSHAYVSRFANLGMGKVVVPGAVIAGNAKAGDFFLANINCSIGHDTVLKANVVLAPGARVSGFSELGNNVFVGSNGVTQPHSIIWDFSIVGSCTPVFYSPEGYIHMGERSWPIEGEGDGN